MLGGVGAAVDGDNGGKESLTEPDEALVWTLLPLLRFPDVPLS